MAVLISVKWAIFQNRILFYCCTDENYLIKNILGHCWRVYGGCPNAVVATLLQFLTRRHNLTSCCSLQSSHCLVKFIPRKEISWMYLCTVCDIRAMALATYFCSTIFVTNAKSSTRNTRLSKMITCVIVYLWKR